MRTSTKILVTSVLLLVLAGLAGADAYYTRSDALPASLTGADAGSGATTSSTQGVPKRAGPDVLAILDTQGFAVQAKVEKNLLQQVVPVGTPTQYRTLLKDGDRTGFVVWVDSPSVKAYFQALKESLLSSFSQNVTDLKDETTHDPGKPVVNTLTFNDPTISEERIEFVRIREQLYEFHVAKGKDGVIQPLIDALVRS